MADSSSGNPRYRRYHSVVTPDLFEEYRSEVERDHDRVIYSSVFKRLAGVTQVVNPSEGEIFHNRLTHSIKVAQVARRLSDKILREAQKDNRQAELELLGGLDAEVVETAALVHDFGNPPFGHIAEAELNTLVLEELKKCQNPGDSDRYLSDREDGFEGNAQSFRIVNRLALGYKQFAGLNLTRATLNAVLKYPFSKAAGKSKYGVYHTECDEFNWARDPYPELAGIRTLEAALMDISDDITYAVHDFEDFYRANLIPINCIVDDFPPDKLRSMIESADEDWFPKDRISDMKKTVKAVADILYSLPLANPYHGKKEERIQIRQFCSRLISGFINSVQINPDLAKYRSPIILSPDEAAQIIVLKKIFRYYIIDHPNLKRLQHGEIQIIRALFRVFLEASQNSDWTHIFPASAREQLLLVLPDHPTNHRERIRIVADVISYLTDSEAIRLHAKLMGISPGSIFDMV